MRSFAILLLSIILFTAVFSKKSTKKDFDKKEFDLDETQNERQVEKQSYYRNKHLDYLTEKDLHKMAKLSPIAVSDEDIRLQADIDLKEEKVSHKSHDKHVSDLRLQHINIDKPLDGKKFETDLNKSKDKQKKYKHSSHKKHEFVKQESHKHRSKGHKSEEVDDKDFLQIKEWRRESHKTKHNNKQKHNKYHKKQDKKSRKNSKKYKY